MTRTVKQASNFLKLNLAVIETVFSSAGETIETVLTAPITPSYKVCSFIFKGSKKIEFPGTGQESIIRHAPSPLVQDTPMYGKKHFITTILEDDTRDYCIVSLTNDYPLEYSITDLDAGNTMNISRGCLIYVAGTNYTINNIICSENELFALENNDVVLVASNSCKVYMFRALPKV